MSDGHEYRTTEEPSELRIELPENRTASASRPTGRAARGDCRGV